MVGQVLYRGQVASGGRSVSLSLVGLPQQLQLSAVALQQQQVVPLQVQTSRRTRLEHRQQLQHALRLKHTHLVRLPAHMFQFEGYTTRCWSQNSQ